MEAPGGSPPYVDKEVIRVTRNGVWLADDEEITHEATVKGFIRNLKKDERGYYVHIGRETKRIEVEDTAYFVLRLDGDPGMGFHLGVNDGTRKRLDPKTLSYRPGRLTCRIQTLDGREDEARFLHSAYFELLKHLQEDGEEYFLMLGSQRISLAKK